MEVVDLHQEYWENVAAYAIDKIRQGLTPNPDVMCNKLIKFGCFEQRVGKDFDFTATGHYATTSKDRPYLRAVAVDNSISSSAEQSIYSAPSIPILM